MYDRIRRALEQQEPRHEPSTRGLTCDACDMGPCSCGTCDKDMRAPCGINSDEMAIKNLAEKISEGLGEYKEYSRHITLSYDIDDLIMRATALIPTSLYFTSTISDMLKEHRKERSVIFGLGGIEQNKVNICAVSAPHHIYTLYKAAQDPSMKKAAADMGADGINVVSLGYPGAEMSYELGMPCIGNYVILDDAYKTGGIDAVYTTGSPSDAVQRGIAGFGARKGLEITVPEKEMYVTGREIDPEVVNTSYRDGKIAGAVVFFGATSPTCTWDMEQMATDLMAAGYLVFVTGARLYEGTMRHYSEPSVVHLGFCEVGKILNLGLSFKPTLVVPGWKNAKLLTSCIAMLKKGYNVVMGVPIPLTETVEGAFRERGMYVEPDGSRAVKLVGTLEQ